MPSIPSELVAIREGAGIPPDELLEVSFAEGIPSMGLIHTSSSGGRALPKVWLGIKTSSPGRGKLDWYPGSPNKLTRVST
ncbi:hypothetical protein PGTUg99_016441 [Puccinia graminis f. sp. tritici]|uniref:Uncharacterized protein n=1 Tax=Puccinia graminis f. sp. tritici TaxID=56615 RepID=A0A5B0SHF5_PUCGR|nr:hypothetical protein PGTUg99_016441 [Puccinia graminis f. sp. tritici]